MGYRTHSLRVRSIDTVMVRRAVGRLGKSPGREASRADATITRGRRPTANVGDDPAVGCGGMTYHRAATFGPTVCVGLQLSPTKHICTPCLPLARLGERASLLELAGSRPQRLPGYHYCCSRRCRDSRNRSSGVSRGSMVQPLWRLMRIARSAARLPRGCTFPNMEIPTIRVVEESCVTT